MPCRVLALTVWCIAVAVGSAAQTFTKLVDLDGTHGANPEGPVIEATDGNFYGTAYLGGSDGYGTVFTMTPEGAYSSLADFHGPNGRQPRAGLVQATDGNFYGTTEVGGHGYGTVIKITPQGVLTAIYSFNVDDGATPRAGLVQATDGNFYGTTFEGGAEVHGTVFKITPQGTLTTLYSFCHQLPCPDGSRPEAGVVQATDGNFYGTTSEGGANGYGTVFKITLGGALTTLHSFNSSDGATPAAKLVQAIDGNFYGTTSAGGTYGAGTVFEITPQGALSTLHSFNGADGLSPDAELVQATDGIFYGTTFFGGSNNLGTLFKITPQGTLTMLHNFMGSMDGSSPQAGLVQASDGNLYGTTVYGGSAGYGTVFRLDVGLSGFLLSVSDDGNGLVSSVDHHIYCGAVCAYRYPKATQVVLSAVPAPGYTFSGWTGCDNVNGSYCSVTISGKKNVIASFTPANVTLTSLTFEPNYVRGGKISAGTLTLNAPAPPGGVTVALGSDHPGVAHPPSFVFVPGGQSSVGFAVNTFPVKSNTTVTITATAGASQVGGTLTVGTTPLPPALR